MIRAIGHILVAAGILLGISGCAKYSSDSLVVITPRLMPVQSSPVTGMAYQVRTYAFYIPENDIDNWKPTSYAEAEAGQISNKYTGEIRSYNLMSEQDPDDELIYFTFTRSPIFLVAVDPINRFYAWRQMEYDVPMSLLYLTVRFQLWKGDAPYTDSGWNVTNAGLENIEEDGTEE